MSEETTKLFLACVADAHPMSRDPRYVDVVSYSGAKKAIANGADVNFRCRPDELSRHGVLVPSSSLCCPLSASGAASAVDCSVTPLLAACYHGQSGLVRLLLDRGADDARAIFAAVEYRFPGEHREDKKLGIAQLLLERGFDARFRAPSGRTALCAAAEAGCPATVELLLDAGAVADDCDCSPLLRAQLGSVPGRAADVAWLLLESGADPERCYSLLRPDSEVAKAVREYRERQSGGEDEEEEEVETLEEKGNRASDSESKSNMNVDQKEKEKIFEVKDGNVSADKKKKEENFEERGGKASEFDSESKSDMIVDKKKIMEEADDITSNSESKFSSNMIADKEEVEILEENGDRASKSVGKSDFNMNVDREEEIVEEKGNTASESDGKSKSNTSVDKTEMEILGEKNVTSCKSDGKSDFNMNVDKKELEIFEKKSDTASESNAKSNTSAGKEEKQQEIDNTLGEKNVTACKSDGKSANPTPTRTTSTRTGMMTRRRSAALAASAMQPPTSPKAKRGRRQASY